MPTFTLRRGPVSFSAEVPEALATRLRQARRRLRPARHGQALPAGRLVVAEQPPTVHLKTREPAETVRHYRRLLGARSPSGGAATDEGAEGDAAGRPLAQEVAGTFWYHTIDLPGGVTTPGVYDHRRLVADYGLPDDLAGRRALDVATFDGFWAFELERRGADVVAIDVGHLSDLDFPPQVKLALKAGGMDWKVGKGFRLARQALGSSVQRLERSVYDLDPGSIGTFDFVHMADLLLHLQDPLAALRAVRRVTDGMALVVDCFDRRLEPGVTRYLGGWEACGWWQPSLDTLGQMVLDAGFAGVRLQGVYSLAGTGGRDGLWRAAFLATT